MSDKKMSVYQVAVAGEAFAAGVLAHLGCDVSVQYGANQPGYDLVAIRGPHVLKISVKGSQDSGWGLIQSYKKGTTYSGAADLWCEAQRKDIVFCLVQFAGVEPGGCPRIYLAWPEEIASVLKNSRGGHGSTILYEDYTFKKGVGNGFQTRLPANWRISHQRLAEIFAAERFL